MDPTPDALCPGCFADPGGTHPCRHCGYDERAVRPPLLLPHRTLLQGQFLVGRVLGRPGGFGITYLGWDLRLERRVAIKEFLPRDLAGRGADQVSVVPHSPEDREVFHYGLEQFLREARTLAKLDHPNIVRVMQVFEANGTAYLVMEFYQGLTLAEHLERQGGRLDEDSSRQLIGPVLDGLRAVHAKGFLHRDIKPQNIYLARTEGGGVRPILLDFGAARQAVGERSQSVSVLGTPGYAPFEQYHSRGQQGPWTDVYAVAAVLYRMVTGSTPVPANERMADDDLPPASAFGVSAALSATLSRALALKPDGRPQSAAAMQAALAPVPAPLGDPAPPVPIPAPAPVRNLWPWMLLGLLAIGALVYWQFNTMEGRHQDDLAFAAAQREDTAAAYRTYLAGCERAGCGHDAAARAALGRGGGTGAAATGAPAADDAFVLAARMNTPEAYRGYLAGCAAAGCPHRDEAQAALERLALTAERERTEAARVALMKETDRYESVRYERDAAAFARARAADTAAAYRGYLDTCAADGCGQRAAAEQAWGERVRGERDVGAFNTARGADSEVAYRAYLDTCHENGCAYAALARQRLGELETARRAAEARAAAARQAQEAQQAPVKALVAYFDHARAGRLDAALASLENPKPSSRKVLENLASVTLNEARLDTIGADSAQVLIDWTGTTKDRKSERYRGLVPMVLRDGTWRIGSFGGLVRQ